SFLSRQGNPDPGLRYHPWNLIRLRPAEGERMSAFTSSYPSSQRVFVDGPHGVRVPMREISIEQGASSLRVYDTSGPQDHDATAGLPKLREPWVRLRSHAPHASSGASSGAVTQLHYARRGEITPEMEF